MKSIRSRSNTQSAPQQSSSLLSSYQRTLAAQIAREKENILSEFGPLFQSHQQLLRLTLNEAEGIAWQTNFPQLVFPALAREKAEALVAWEAHQQSIRQREAALLAA